MNYLVLVYVLPMILVLGFSSVSLFSKKDEAKRLVLDGKGIATLAFIPLVNILVTALIVFSLIISIKHAWDKS